MSRGLNIFLISLAAALVFKMIEIYFGIENGFHPDSNYYVENYPYYTSLGIFKFSTFNNLYFFIVAIAGGDSVTLIFLNQVIFAITNVIIARKLDIGFRGGGFAKWYLLFLPYRLHLCNHVLKDTFIILGVVATLVVPTTGLLLTTLFNAAMRNVTGPATLLVRMLPKSNKVFFIFLGSIILILAAVPQLANALSDRGAADMTSRDYFDVPLSNATDLALIGLKAIFWPLLAKTGGFAFFSGSPVVYVLAIEPFIFLCWAVLQSDWKGYFLCRGALVMVIFSGLVTNYGAYYRYIYAFMIVDYIETVVLARRRRDLRP